MNEKTNKNFEVVLTGLKAFDQSLFERGAKGMKAGLLGAVAIAQREFLSGPRPRVLDVVTRRLRDSISSSVEIQPERGVVGRIGSNVVYAAYHEFGFSGIMHVKAHSRVTRQISGLGHDLDSRTAVMKDTGEFAGWKESSRKRASRAQKTGFTQVQFVKAHDRRVNYAGRPFVRPAVEKAMPLILQEIRKELNA